jgi:hypothetical protein
MFRAVFFNLGSAEPRGSAKIFLGSSKYLYISFLAIYGMHSKKFKHFYATGRSNLINFKFNFIVIWINVFGGLIFC